MPIRRPVFKVVSAAHLGAIREFEAATALMRKGFYVYKAMANNAPFDLIAIKEDKLYKVEVRGGYRKVSGGFHVSKREQSLKSGCNLFVLFDQHGTMTFEPEV